MERRNFLRLLSASALPASAVGLAGCSSELPPEAVAAWRGPAEGGDVRLWLLGSPGWSTCGGRTRSPCIATSPACCPKPIRWRVRS
jgi:hypothetical protein